jgi:hypothetical protein
VGKANAPSIVISFNLYLYKNAPLSLTEIYSQFITGLKQTGALEFIAVIMGIVSVYFSRK